jgi:ribonuclease P protein component
VRANGLEVSRFAVSAGRGIGNAVARNHAKRRAREAIRRHMSEIHQGWDCLIVLFPASASEPFGELENHLLGLLARARMLRQPSE